MTKRQRLDPVWWLQGLERRLTGRASAESAQLLHRDPDLFVAWLPGRTSRLVLVFLSMIPKPLNPDRLEFMGVASNHGENPVVFINDRRWTWYSKPAMRDRITSVVRQFIATHGIDEVWSVGNSMGGYGAILFCDRLPISNVVAFVPQILLTDYIIRLPDWLPNRSRITRDAVHDLTPIMAAADTRFSIVTGDAESQHNFHRDHLLRQLPDAGHVQVMIAPGQAHDVARWVKDQGQLPALVNALWREDRQRLEKCSKAMNPPLDLRLALSGGMTSNDAGNDDDHV